MNRLTFSHTGDTIKYTDKFMFLFGAMRPCRLQNHKINNIFRADLECKIWDFGSICSWNWPYSVGWSGQYETIGM